MTADQTRDMIDTYKGKLNDEVKGLQNKSAELESLMKGLKSELYGKFGSAINLEYD